MNAPFYFWRITGNDYATYSKRRHNHDRLLCNTSKQTVYCQLVQQPLLHNSLNIYGLLHKKTNHNTIFERNGCLYLDSRTTVTIHCSSHLNPTKYSIHFETSTEKFIHERERERGGGEGG